MNMVWLMVAIVILSGLAMLVCSIRQRMAETKGLTLLVSNLSEEQRRQYEAFGYFDAIGSITGKRYRIHHGNSRNVVQLGSGNLRSGRCFAPRGDLVPGDCMLAQKIAIENYEAEVLAKALPF